MVRQRYEMMDSRWQDDYARTGGAVKRYEVGRQSLKALQSSAKVKNIRVYKNGAQTKSDPPCIVSFKSKKYPSFDKLLEEISDRKRTSANFLFKWPLAEMVRDLCDIDDTTDILVCSDKKKLNIDICYGGISYGATNGDRSALTEKSSRNSHGSRGMKQSPTARMSNASLNGGGKVKTTLNVISNKTGERINLFKDPNSKQSFEDFLMTIQEMLDPYHPPVHTLYIMNKPQRKINSISSLNRALQSDEDTFLACGKNEEPDQKMLRSRDTSPMRNGNQQRQKNGNKQNGYHEDRTRQNNGHATHQERHMDSHGRSYQRHRDEEDYEDDTEQEEYDQEPSSPPPRRGGRYQDQSPKRDSRQPPYRQSQRRDEEDQSPRYQDQSPKRDSRQPPYRQSQRRDEEDQSPLRDNRQAPKRRSQRKDDDEEEEDTPRRGNRRESERQKPKRQQTPPRRDETSRGKTRDDTDNDDNNDDDNDDEDRERDHPSEEEMQRRIDAMETIDQGELDKKIHY
ncbi:myb-like protein AA [Mercenaria mercenaria]|uniref:myb-like protein AA n=1 Tax=Mercenaria mercenaria TaxID=6596 RepID=UPI00234EA1F8|nr:myb-like protein AA [Mercenaria mercenaria]